VISSVHVTYYLFLTEGGNKISTVKMLWSSICFCIKETQRNATNTTIF